MDSKKTPKCSSCKKKLNIIRQTINCKCDLKYFCETHLLDHECNYNHKQHYEIYKRVIKPKVDKI